MVDIRDIEQIRRQSEETKERLYQEKIAQSEEEIINMSKISSSRLINPCYINPIDRPRFIKYFEEKGFNVTVNEYGEITIKW